MAWTDSHCHLQDPKLGVDAVVAAAAAGVERIVCVGTDLDESRKAVALAASLPGQVWATVGLHPHDAVRWESERDGLVALLGEPGVVAVGECGLDYHYDHSPRAAQRAAFAAQVALAHQHDLALVIHTRSAWDDTFAVLADAGVPPRTVFHCFSGGLEEAERALAIGAALSFSGIVSFKSADDVRAAARLCPADRLLVETDAPLLAPVPHRGKPNQPGWVPVVGAAVAAARDEPVELVEASSHGNAEAFLRLHPSGGAV